MTSRDPAGLPFDAWGPSKPTPWPLGTLINSPTYLGQFGLVSTCLIFACNGCEEWEDEGWGKANFRTFVQDPTDLRVSVFFLAEFSNSISALAGNVNKLQYMQGFLSWDINAGLNCFPFFEWHQQSLIVVLGLSVGHRLWWPLLTSCLILFMFLDFPSDFSGLFISCLQT